MSYVTVEDDTAAIEMLAFSNVINQYGGYLRENQPVVITGRLSMRDDKDAQIVINRARPITDFANVAADEEIKQVPTKLSGTLYLRLPSENDPIFRKIRAIINMFPGEMPAVVFFADTKQRRGARCTLDSRMITELTRVLGQENVVVK